MVMDGGWAWAHQHGLPLEAVWPLPLLTDLGPEPLTSNFCWPGVGYIGPLPR